MDALILCIETSSLPFSVALTRSGVVIQERTAVSDDRLARDITVFIQDVCAAAGVAPGELNAVAVSSGPGSYTGLRIGMSVAKGLCFGLDIPLIALPTSYCLAAAACVLHNRDLAGLIYLSMIDARRMEVYAQAFDAQLKSVMDLQPVIFPEQTGLFEKWRYNRIILAGDGAKKMLPFLTQLNVTDIQLNQSAALLALPASRAYTSGAFADLDTAAPLYCKAPNITTAKKLDKLFGRENGN